MRTAVIILGLAGVLGLAGCGGGDPAADATGVATTPDASPGFCDRVGASSWDEVLGDLAELGDPDPQGSVIADGEVCRRPSTSEDDEVARAIVVQYDGDAADGDVQSVRDFLDDANAGYRDVSVAGADDAIVTNGVAGGAPSLVADVGGGLLTVQNDATGLDTETISEVLGDALVALAEQVIVAGLS